MKRLIPKHSSKEQWHKWFAWRPVFLVDDSSDPCNVLVWWEYVMRRKVPVWDCSYWEYKEIEEK